jgi:uncharacterized protein (TIGR02271 family)
MEHEPRQNIVSLDDSDLEVADDNPDVRGWEVISADNRRIGEVEDLLVDTTAMKVRYLDVEVDDELRGSDEEKHILIPIGYARLNEDDDRILVNELSSEQVRTVPAYTGRFDPQYEQSLGSYFGAGTGGGFDARRDDRLAQERGATGHTGEERIALSEEELAVGREQRQAGEVRVGKHVETEHVKRDVPVSHEEVEIERRPIEGDRMEGRARIEEDEIRVPLNEERAVVQKRTVPREEIVLRKRQVQGTQRVEADLRREEADIDRQGNVRASDDDTNRNR